MTLKHSFEDPERFNFWKRYITEVECVRIQQTDSMYMDFGEYVVTEFYKKAEHSTTWRYNYTEYHWSWTGYKKSGGNWVKDKSRSGVDRVHNDPQSFMESYF